jgi:HEAT repeat protein
MKALLFMVAAAALLEPQSSELDKMGKRVTERAAKDFKNKDAEKRLGAVESLSSWKTTEGTAILIQGLSDPDERVRAASARSLGTYDKEAEPARAALMKALDDPRASVVAQAAEALEKALKLTEKELGPARTRVLEEGNLTEKFLAARSLTKQVAAMRLVGPILEYTEAQFPGLSSSEYKTRDASDNNVKIGETALQNLVKQTRDRSIITSLQNAARGFSQRNDIPLEALALYDPRPDGWAKLLVASLGFKDPRVVSDVLFLMGRTATSASDVATWAPEAVRLEKHPDASVRHRLVYALGEARGLASDQIDVVVRALQNETDKGARENAASAIGDIGDKNQATPAAGKRLVAERASAALRTASEKDPDAGVRDQAARSLARLQAPGSAAGGASHSSPPPTSAAPSASRPKAAAAGGQSEADALSLLRSKKMAFDVNSFFGALTERDPAVVQAYLDAGMDPNDRADKAGDSPLSFLLRAGACSPVQRPTPAVVKDLVNLLLARGANVNLADAQSNTPLMHAAMMGCDRETIALLIKAGAKVDAKNASGLAAFELGLYSGHDGLEELIAAGYRLPADKAAIYRQGYASQPKSIALINKATAPK